MPHSGAVFVCARACVCVRAWVHVRACVLWQPKMRHDLKPGSLTPSFSIFRPFIYLIQSLFFFLFLILCSLSYSFFLTYYLSSTFAFVSHAYPPPTLSCSPFPVLPLNHCSVLSLSLLSSRGPFPPHSFTVSSFLFFLYFFRGLPSWPLTLTGAQQETRFSALSGAKPPLKPVDNYHQSKISAYLQSCT